MKNSIKKTIVATALLASTLLSADGYIKAKYAQQDSTVGEARSDALTGSMYGVGFGATNHFGDTNFLYGGEFALGYGSFEDDDGYENGLTTFGVDLKLGYTFFDSLSLFGILGYEGSYVVAEYENEQGGTENDTLFGSSIKYGAGLEYQPLHWLSVGAEYTISKPDFESTESDFTIGSNELKVAGVYVKLIF